MEILLRTIVLAVGWPVLIIGSIFIFLQGKRACSAVAGSLIGKLSKTLVGSMIIGMYSLGVIATAYMFDNPRSVYLVIPVFLIWFIAFMKSLAVLKSACDETKKIMEGTTDTTNNS